MIIQAHWKSFFTLDVPVIEVDEQINLNSLQAALLSHQNANVLCSLSFWLRVGPKIPVVIQKRFIAPLSWFHIGCPGLKFVQCCLNSNQWTPSSSRCPSLEQIRHLYSWLIWLKQLNSPVVLLHDIMKMDLTFFSLMKTFKTHRYLMF